MAAQLALVLVDSHSCSCRCFGAQLSQTILDKLHHHWPELCCKQHPAAARNRSWPAAEDATLVGRIIRWTTPLKIHDLRLSWTHGLPKHRHVRPTKQSMFFSKRNKTLLPESPLINELERLRDYIDICYFSFYKNIVKQREDAEVEKCKSWAKLAAAKCGGANKYFSATSSIINTIICH